MPLVSAGFGTGGGMLAEGDAAAQALAEAAWAAGRAPRLRERSNCAAGRCPTAGSETTRRLCRLRRAICRTTTRHCSPGLPRRQRAEVRRAREFGLEISFGSDDAHRAAHYRVYAESVRNLGTPVFPRALFDAALDEFGDDAEILIVWQRGPRRSPRC